MIGSEKYKLNSKTLLRGQQETYIPSTHGLNKKALQIITVFLLSTTVFADNYSLSFDGVDDYVEVPDIGSLDAFTFEMWVRIDGNIGEYRGLFGTQSWGVSRVHWQIGSDNNLRCSIDGGGGSTYGVVGNYIFDESTIGQWFHLAASYQSGETVKLFVNGVFDGEANMTQTVNLTGLRIGDDEINL